MSDVQRHDAKQKDAATTIPTVAYQPSTTLFDESSGLKCFSYGADFKPTELPTSYMISSPCAFDAEIFGRVMFNLIRNPNITSSHLFRADVFYDSATDASYNPDAYSVSNHVELVNDEAPFQLSNFIKHMRSELKPRMMTVDGFELRRTIVRQMVPRNTQLDRSLPQTCHFFRRRRRSGTLADGHAGSASDRSEGTDAPNAVESEDNLVIYVPHVSNADEIPWYHPKVKALYFVHSSTTTIRKDTSCEMTPSTISIHISLFPPGSETPGASSINSQDSTEPPKTDRLTRTLQNLLSTIHRHGTGQAAGYQKRVHHDRLIPQSRLQDTYTRLKNTYAKDLLHKYWQEQTDATKGIFEDLGIAAFCIELWKVMYDEKDKPFPGFVDIGCGNGVLSFILLSEGYTGFGFDARSRKTWDAFPAAIRDNLHELVLVPSIFAAAESLFPSPAAPTSQPINAGESGSTIPDTDTAHIPTKRGAIPTHPGLFRAGTFIISNHADELTIWTPLLAYLNNSPFISIPCCSHDLSGARCRFPPPPSTQDKQEDAEKVKMRAIAAAQGAPKTKPSQPSAYATLCAAVARLAREVGYVAEEEVLRIPSTRNVAIVGRTWKKADIDGEVLHVQSDVYAGATADDEGGTDEHEWRRKEDVVRGIVSRELGGRSVEDVAREWREKAAKLAGSKGDAGKH